MTWANVVPRLPATPAVKAQASKLEFIRLDGFTVHLRSKEPVSRAFGLKLARALNEQTGKPVAVVLHYHGQTSRHYYDHSRI